MRTAGTAGTASKSRLISRNREFTLTFTNTIATLRLGVRSLFPSFNQISFLILTIYFYSFDPPEPETPANEDLNAEMVLQSKPQIEA